MGSPSAVLPSGSEIAAQPVTFAIGVHPVWANSTSKKARVLPRGWSSTPYGGGGASSVGTSSTSCPVIPAAKRRVCACSASIASA